MQPLSAKGLAAALRQSWMIPHPRAWKLPPLETYPAVVSFAQTYAGKLVLVIVFAALMRLVARGMTIETDGLWLGLTIAAALISLAGRHRMLALLACTGVLLAHNPGWFNFAAVYATLEQHKLGGSIDPWTLRAVTFVACVPLAVIAMHLAQRYREHSIGRRPVIVQHVVFVGLLGLAASHSLQGIAQAVLWSVTATFAAYFWYLAYALIDRRHREAPPLLLQFATFNPFAWATMVPLGKGAANWQSLGARTAEDLAVTQLKGLKLLVWALLLALVLWAFRTIVYVKLGVPPLEAALQRFLRAGEAPLGALSIAANFPEQLLMMAIWGHAFVALARLAGFRLLRNTYRPLSSRTIAEFWNRFNFYFKEILVNVYFYPTYVRCFKRHPRLRIAFATFMAAGAGNFFFHFIWKNHEIVQFGLVEALLRSQAYAFYCIVLTAGIVVSQLRARRPDSSDGWFRARFAPSLGVALFFCFLSVFDGPLRHATVPQHFDFLFQAFGIKRWM
jgi:hypothetical protein